MIVGSGTNGSGRIVNSGGVVKINEVLAMVATVIVIGGDGARFNGIILVDTTTITTEAAVTRPGTAASAVIIRIISAARF
jgi:hypothetical protein